MASFGGLVHVLVILIYVTKDTIAELEHTSGDKTLDKLHSTHVVHKRAPGWGKRNLNDISDEFSSDLGWEDDDSDAIVADEDMSKRAPGWGKRTYEHMDVLDKRAPGWGKRNLVSVMDEKRAPGWGKRDAFSSQSLDWEKRAPGWGKRAPGWGKRAPGWGKRAPGWGKRAPGWGKRAPGWGKRAPGWGKRSDPTICNALDKQVDFYIYKAIQIDAQRRLQCSDARRK